MPRTCPPPLLIFGDVLKIRDIFWRGRFAPRNARLRSTYSYNYRVTRTAENHIISYILDAINHDKSIWTHSRPWVAAFLGIRAEANRRNSSSSNRVRISVSFVNLNIWFSLYFRWRSSRNPAEAALILHERRTSVIPASLPCPRFRLAENGKTA